MWLITPIGFFSVVQKAADVSRGTLTVRARVRSDLEALRAHCLPGLEEIEEATHSDYRFRAAAPRADVAAAMAALVAGIHYNNFKAEVARVQGPERAHWYQKVWEILYRLQTSVQAGGGVRQSAAVALPGKAWHPRNDAQGRPLLLLQPSVPTAPSTWQDPTQEARVVPDGWMPGRVNDVVVSHWKQAPQDDAGWNALADDVTVAAPTNEGIATVGVVILEADGRVWLSVPSNPQGGYHATFPSIALSSGLSAAAAALKASHLATGLHVRLRRELLDVSGAAGVRRFYLAERVGGHPADMGWVAQAVLLTPLIAVEELLRDTQDLPALEALLGRS